MPAATVQQAISQQGAFSLDNTGQTSVQELAASYLDQILSLLNTQVGSNYIFSGSAVNQPSVASANHILNGNGTQAGLTQLIAERQQADLGTNDLGRLTVGGTGSNVTLSQDGSPFGFQLASVNSSLTGATVTGPSGSPPSLSVALGSNPNAGESIEFNLTLPDGSSQSITLPATTSSPPGANQFTIGATPAETAANLQTALTSAIGSLAQTALPAASSIAAANDFFNWIRRRLSTGPPYDTATSLVSGTPANTVFWYTGENGSTPALQTATAQVGPSMSDRLWHARHRTGHRLADGQRRRACRHDVFGERSERAGELPGAVPAASRRISTANRARKPSAISKPTSLTRRPP